MPYKVRLTGRARKELTRLPQAVQSRVLAALRDLAVTPRPSGNKKLTGQESYRMRVRNYRVLYDVDDESQLVEVWRIQHRRDVYRDL